MSKSSRALMRWRKKLGLSQEEAAEMLVPRASQTAWASWETGAKLPGVRNAFAIQTLTAGLIVASSWVSAEKRPTSKSSMPVAKAS